MDGGYVKESVRGKRVFGGDVSLTAGTSGWMTDRDSGWGGDYLAPLASALLPPRVDLSVSFEPLKDDIWRNAAIIDVVWFFFVFLLRRTVNNKTSRLK